MSWRSDWKNTVSKNLPGPSWILNGRKLILSVNSDARIYLINTNSCMVGSQFVNYYVNSKRGIKSSWPYHTWCLVIVLHILRLLSCIWQWLVCCDLHNASIRVLTAECTTSRLSLSSSRTSNSTDCRMLAFYNTSP